MAKPGRSRRTRQHKAGGDQKTIQGKADHCSRSVARDAGVQRGCGAGTRIVTIWPLIGSKTVMVIARLQHQHRVGCPANASKRDGFRVVFGCG